MAPRRKFHGEDIKSQLICDTDSDDYAEDIESDKDENDYNDEQPSPPMHVQALRLH